MEKALQQFDRQIKFEFNIQLKKAVEQQGLNTSEIIKWKKDKKNLLLCESYLAKEIFLKTIDFTINDWKKIRTGDYFQEIDLEKGINKKLYLLTKIQNYLNESK